MFGMSAGKNHQPCLIANGTICERPHQQGFLAAHHVGISAGAGYDGKRVREFG
jgi:hypothetical protein